MPVSNSCFFKRLVTWEDPNLSASFLTVGNLAVAFLLFSANVSNWVLFLIVWGVFPLGLAARIGGFEKQLSFKSAESAIAHHYKGHIAEKSSAQNIIILGVYLIIVAKLVSLFGVVMMMGIVGNAVLLGPMVVKQLREKLGQVRVHGVSMESMIQKTNEGLSYTSALLTSLHPMALPGAVGASVFLGVLLLGEFVTSQLFLVSCLSIAGYVVVLSVVLLPASVVASVRDRFIPSEKSVTSVMGSLEASKRMHEVTRLFLWENYPRSIAAFIAVYSVYVVSSLVGVVPVIALVVAIAATIANTPTAVIEKMQEKISDMKSLVLSHPVAQRIEALVSPKIDDGFFEDPFTVLSAKQPPAEETTTTE